MSKGLKGIRVEIDGNTKPLQEALSKVNTETRSLQGELRGVNSLLKFDHQNTELLAQKQTVLAKAIEQTESKLRVLLQAQKEMSEAGKDINDEEYRDLQREIAATQQKLAGYNTQLKNTKKDAKQAAKETETLGQEIRKIASHIPGVNKLADGFQKVKQKIKETVKESAAVQKIGTAAEGVRRKVDAFKNSHPHVKKVADAFQSVGKKAEELAGKIPSVRRSLTAMGDAAAGGFKALGGVIGGTAKAFGAFAGAALTAGAEVAKQSLKNYADYEQLVGGVETLFGAGGQSLSEYAKSVGKSTKEASKEYESLTRAQDTVLKNADNAYKTAGLSANQYMETVTGFSASLINSMGGDTEAAAKKADMAITDMADNANKMGTDMETIQMSYQSFARGNYAMLDNLKLGYGGTKEEMQRLLEDAGKLSGIEYDISSYADIVDAIHAVQTEMGITGTTAKEANETISGSVQAAKSAWQNLTTGLADENADLDGLIDNMTDSVLTVIDNVLPRITKIVPRIVETVPKLIQGLSDAFKGLAGQLGGLMEQLLPPLMQAFFTLIKTVTSALPALLPQLIDLGSQILLNLIQGITQTIPSLITTIVELIPVIVQSIMENLPLLMEAGLNLLLSLATGVIQAIPQLIAMLPMIIDAIVTNLISMLPRILETGAQVLQTLTTGITQAIPQLIAMLPQIISNIVNTLIANLPQIISAGITLIGALISGLIQAIPQLVAAIPQIVTAIFDTFKAINWAELGGDIIDGIINGVKNAAGSLIDVFKNLAASALEEVKGFFGIASPSKVMRDEVGKMLPAGIAEGVEEGMDEEERRIRAAMKKGVPTTIDSYIKQSGSGKRIEGREQQGNGGFVQNLTINSPRELSPSETARLNRNAMRQTVLKLKPT